MNEQRTGLALAAAALTLAIAAPAHAAGDIARGKAKSASCVACHGVDGNSPSTAFPRLAGQHASYLAHALLAYTTGERTNAIMQGLAAPLSKQDRVDLAAWFASQKGLNTAR
jgi:cytochrome c553